MAKSDEMIKLAMQHAGEKYDWGADVPFDQPDYRGPWDCAEFASWVIYQVSGQVLGCTNNKAALRKLEPYSGAWARDGEALSALLSPQEAAGVRGAVLVRKPRHEKPGHVSLSRGDGTTIEAMDTAHGVAVGKIAGRKWDICFKLPNFD